MTPNRRPVTKTAATEVASSTGLPGEASMKGRLAALAAIAPMAPALPDSILSTSSSTAVALFLKRNELVQEVLLPGLLIPKANTMRQVICKGAVG